MKVDVESGGNGSTVPFSTVILSGVAASRSEAAAESKDPLACERRRGVSRHSHDAECAVRIVGRMPCGIAKGTGVVGVLRLRIRCASRIGYFAQDDRVRLTAWDLRIESYTLPTGHVHCLPLPDRRRAEQ